MVVCILSTSILAYKDGELNENVKEIGSLESTIVSVEEKTNKLYQL